MAALRCRRALLTVVIAVPVLAAAQTVDTDSAATSTSSSISSPSSSGSPIPTSSTSTPKPADTGKGGLSPAQLGGVIGACAFAATLLAIVGFIWLRSRQRKRLEEPKPATKAVKRPEGAATGDNSFTGSVSTKRGDVEAGIVASPAEKETLVGSALASPSGTSHLHSPLPPMPMSYNHGSYLQSTPDLYANQPYSYPYNDQTSPTPMGSRSRPVNYPTAHQAHPTRPAHPTFPPASQSKTGASSTQASPTRPTMAHAVAAATPPSFGPKSKADPIGRQADQMSAMPKQDKSVERTHTAEPTAALSSTKAKETAAADGSTKPVSRLMAIMASKKQISAATAAAIPPDISSMAAKNAAARKWAKEGGEEKKGPSAASRVAAWRQNLLRSNGGSPTPERAEKEEPVEEKKAVEPEVDTAKLLAPKHDFLLTDPHARSSMATSHPHEDVTGLSVIGPGPAAPAGTIVSTTGSFTGDLAWILSGGQVHRPADIDGPSAKPTHTPSVYTASSAGVGGVYGLGPMAVPMPVPGSEAPEPRPTSQGSEFTTVTSTTRKRPLSDALTLPSYYTNRPNTPVNEGPNPPVPPIPMPGSPVASSAIFSIADPADDVKSTASGLTSAPSDVDVGVQPRLLGIGMTASTRRRMDRNKMTFKDFDKLLIAESVPPVPPAGSTSGKRHEISELAGDLPGPHELSADREAVELAACPESPLCETSNEPDGPDADEVEEEFVGDMSVHSAAVEMLAHRNRQRTRRRSNRTPRRSAAGGIIPAGTRTNSGRWKPIAGGDDDGGIYSDEENSSNVSSAPPMPPLPPLDTRFPYVGPSIGSKDDLLTRSHIDLSSSDDNLDQSDDSMDEQDDPPRPSTAGAVLESPSPSGPSKDFDVGSEPSPGLSAADSLGEDLSPRGWSPRSRSQPPLLCRSATTMSGQTRQLRAIEAELHQRLADRSRDRDRESRYRGRSGSPVIDLSVLTSQSVVFALAGETS